MTTVTPRRWWTTSSRPTGTARVAGLSAVLGGATTFTGGNILMGGAGTDLIEGRGGDDVIDGDAQLNVRISVRSGVTEPTTQIDSVETLAGVSARLLAGTINPGQLRIVREIQTPANGTAVDTALFSGPRANYNITFGATATTVVHARGTPSTAPTRCATSSSSSSRTGPSRTRWFLWLRRLHRRGSPPPSAPPTSRRATAG